MYWLHIHENFTQILSYLQSPKLAGQIQRSLLRLVHHAGIRLVLQQHLRLREKGRKDNVSDISLMYYAHALTSKHILFVSVDVLSLNRGEEHIIALVRLVFRIVSIVRWCCSEEVRTRCGLYDRLRCVCVRDMCIYPLRHSRIKMYKAGGKECV